MAEGPDRIPIQIDDVRLDPAFEETLFPLANGLRPPPVGTRDPVSQIKIAFLNVYYRMNLACRNVLEAGHGARSLPFGERQCGLDRLEVVLCQRDSLDREYWARGIRAEAVYRAGLVVDIQFYFPPKHSSGGEVLRSTEVGVA